MTQGPEPSLVLDLKTEALTEDKERGSKKRPIVKVFPNQLTEKIPMGSLASPKKARLCLWTLSRPEQGQPLSPSMPPAGLWVPAALAHCFGDISLHGNQPQVKHPRKQPLKIAPPRAAASWGEREGGEKRGADGKLLLIGPRK